MSRLVILAGLLVGWTVPFHAQQKFTVSDILLLAPAPHSSIVPPETQLLFRFDRDVAAMAMAQDFVEIVGSVTGRASGDVSIASDDQTLLFHPVRPFVRGEQVSVQLHVNLAYGRIDSSYSFRIAEGETIKSRPTDDLAAEIVHPGHLDKTVSSDPVVLNGVSIPSDFPSMQVLYSDNPAPGHVFLNNWGGQPYNIIVDSQGAPVWYLRTPDRRRDFKLQPNGWLTMLVREGYGGGIGHIALDSTFAIVDTMRASNGYITDEHELTMLPNGNYFVIGRREETVNMSLLVVGGQTNATVRETVIQEFTPRGELIFQWRSWDNYDIRDVQLENLQGSYIRFPHMNAISIDDDGHILVSARHLSEVTKINRQTGEIIWRLGGAHNQFRWVNDSFNGFANQHDIRALGNNRYTIFDNGNGHSTPETRAVEYEIDTVNMTATLIWEYRHTPRRYTPWMGNTQRLPNGNTLVNYADASLPKVTEVRPDGSRSLEMDFVSPANSYRVFKFDWMGKARQPYLIAESYPDRVTLIFNKFGDSDVDHFNVYGGTSPGPTTIIVSSDVPFVHLTEIENRRRHYFRVTAVDGAGIESEYSNEETIYVNLTMPGTNMVRNGDFVDGLAEWDFEVNGDAQASVTTLPGSLLTFAIERSGVEWWNIQLRQPGMPLINGREYVFEFDAYADGPRVFEAKVTRDGDPWDNYGMISPIVLATQLQHYRYSFTMDQPSDFAARVVINVGKYDADVHMGNVTLREAVATGGLDRVDAAAGLTLHPPFPNPARHQARIEYELGEPGHVTLDVYNIIGRRAARIVDEWQPAGGHTQVLDAAGLPAGVYYYHLGTCGSTGSETSVVDSVVFVL
jgi:hypothetical protein